MKRFLLFLPLLFLSCSGYKYASMPALEFQDIDYGYETKKSQGNPSIAYIDQGSGSETMILVHGLASNAGFWRYVIPEFAKNYRVIAVDLPGYGKSDKGNFDYGMTYYSEQILALIDDLGLDKVIYVGHSMGGQIGITLSLNHPERISKLVLASPAGIEPFKPGEGKWLSNVFRIDDLVLTSEEAVRINLNRNFYSWDERYEWLVEERVRMAKAADMKEFSYAVIQSVRGMINEPTTARLPEIQNETLIIYGKNDGLIPNPFLHPGFTSEVFEKGAEAIPNASLHEIDECGHMLQIEKPKEFVEGVLKFLGR